MTRKTKAKAESVADGEPTFECQFCQRSFRRESTLMAHMCEQKERFLDKDRKHVKLAFKVYQHFYTISYRAQKPKTYEDFAKSKYFRAFTKFGKYLLDVNAVNMMAFVDFLIKMQVPLDDWCKESVYQLYLREYTKKETPLAAIERNFLLMQQWELETGEDWRNFFRKVQPTLATMWIRAGRISPWLLYTAQSAQDLFSRMSEEQVNLIRDAIDPKYWEKKLRDEAENIKVICDILEEEGI